MARKSSWNTPFGLPSRLGLEQLEDRRLLTSSGWEGLLPIAADAQSHELRTTPLDTSDWSISSDDGRGVLDPAVIFNLQSLPGANHTIYLDFDGHITSGTIWNSNYGIDPIISPGFDLDGDPSSFGQSELQRILVSWKRTAEDYAPFNINVTTRDPGLDALTNTGGGDTTWGARAVVTFDTFANCGCGGHAFLNSFDDSVDTPTFVYNLGEGSLGETFSHEVGHMLGLSHDGTSSQTYYPGHGTGATRWGAIMGAPFDGLVTQWDRGEYFNASNQQDDLQIITSQNGFTYRTDDFGNSIATAGSLDVSGGTSVHAYGIIERNTDRDYFAFDTGGGTVSFNLTPLETRPNVDIFAALYDASGNLITFNNPGPQLSASLSASVAAGRYFLRVEGVGSHDVFNTTTDNVDPPAVKPWQNAGPTGYSDYGSLGQYTINGTIIAAGNNNFSITATDAVKPEGASGTQAFTFTVSRGSTVGAASVDVDLVATLPAMVGDSTPDPATSDDFLGGTTFSGTVQFANGQASLPLTFEVLGDATFEFDEYFDLQLSNPTAGWVLADSRATGIILSDESEFGLNTAGTDPSANEGPHQKALIRWRQVGGPATGASDEWAIDNIVLENSTLVEDFDPINNANWSTISNGQVNSQFFMTDGNGLTMTGGSDRRIVTRLLDASPGDMLSFDIIFGNGFNGGENADLGEDVVLEFSVDGGHDWQEFAVFDTEAYPSWTSVQVPLPSGIDMNPPSQVLFTVERMGGAGQSATVDWAVEVTGLANPADADDFPGGVLPSGQLNFAPGESTGTIAVEIQGDTDWEANENFRLVLTGVSGDGTPTLDPQALSRTATINNDDAAYNVNPGPQFRWRQVNHTGSDWDNWGIDNVSFSGGGLDDDFDPNIDLAQWDNVSGGMVNTNFGGSANSLYFTGNGDRSITTHPLTAQSGDMLSFDFIYGNDFNGGESPESGEHVLLEYSTDDGQNWTLIQTFALSITTWTTINVPVPPATITPPLEAPEGVPIVFDVQRFGIDPTTIESTVMWQVVGSGSNPADASDFVGGVLPSGTLTFAAGEVVKSVTIDVADDGQFEPDETFDFVLMAAGGNPVATATILNNDTVLAGDFNGDGDYDCDDVDALIDHIVDQTDILTYDMNSDAALDVSDLHAWLAVAGSINLPSGAPYLLGDANLDGEVNGQDFVLWNTNKFTSGAGWCGADFNASGTTDGQDFVLWNAEKFNSSSVRLSPTVPLGLPTDVPHVEIAPSPGTQPTSKAIVPPPAPLRAVQSLAATRSNARQHDAAFSDWGQEEAAFGR